MKLSGHVNTHLQTLDRAPITEQNKGTFKIQLGDLKDFFEGWLLTRIWMMGYFKEQKLFNDGYITIPSIVQVITYESWKP